MKRRAFIVLEIMLWLLVGAMFLMQEGRIQKLEKICHGQCKYGDEECQRMCAKAGHCEFQNMGE